MSLIRRGMIAVLLILIWVFLWGSASPANLLSGALIVVFLFSVYPLDTDVGPRVVRPIALLRLMGTFVVDLITANAIVSASVFWPSRGLTEGVIKYDMSVDDPAIITMVTNLTALTPGSMVVHIEFDQGHPVLWVHLFTPGDPKTLVRSIRRLERDCVRAFGTDRHVAIVEAKHAAHTGPSESSTSSDEEDQR